MTIPDEVEQPARESTDAELAFGLKSAALHIGQLYLDSARVKAWKRSLRLAAQRLEARGEISEAMVERAAIAICDRLQRITNGHTIWHMIGHRYQEFSRDAGRAALEAALSGKEE